MLKSTLLQPLKSPNIVRRFNASYTRFSIWGLSTISFNNHPHDLRLSTNNFRAASIEQVSHSLSSAYFQIIMVQRKWFETLILDNDACHKHEKTWYSDLSKERKEAIGSFGKRLPSQKPWLYAQWKRICQFAETFQDEQEDLGQKGKNQNQRRTMMIWINALENEWETCSIETARKIIGRQPKVMRVIIEADGQTSYWEPCIAGIETPHNIGEFQRLQ